MQLGDLYGKGPSFGDRLEPDVFPPYYLLDVQPSSSKGTFLISEVGSMKISQRVAIIK